MEPGSIWAYRKRAIDPLEPVRFVRHRQGKGRKYEYSLVRFERPEKDGLEEWVPDGRLKCMWDDADDFLAREQRWSRVTEASRCATDLETAVGMVIEQIASPHVIQPAPGSSACVYSVGDLATLERITGLSADVIQGAPESFWDKRTLIIPLATSVEIAKHLSIANPDRVLRDIELEEREKAEEDLHDKQLGYTRTGQSVEWDEAIRRSWQIRREWVGEDNDWLRQDALAKTEEAERLRGLVEWAITKLAHYGHESSAGTLQRYLDGAPLPYRRR